MECQERNNADASSEQKLQEDAKPDEAANGPLGGTTVDKGTATDSDVAQGDKCDARPATAPAVGSQTWTERNVSSPSKPKTERAGTRSVLGVAIGSPPTSPSKNGTPRVNLHVTGKLVKRYREEVKASEAGRRQVFVPLDGFGSTLDTKEFLRTKDMEVRNVAGSIKVKLDEALKAARVQDETASWSPASWDGMLRSDDARKEFQFLSYYAKNGSFTERYSSDSQYEGEFVHGMRDGNGTYKYGGEVYEGEWKWDKKHGKGKLTLADGSTVSGMWVDGQQHGRCTLTDAQGKVTYEGEFKQGKRDGLGRQVYPNGDVYNGCWQEGRMHDRGEYHFVNGDRFDGMWKRGVYDGPGIFHHADGSVSRRVYQDGRLMSVQEFVKGGQRFGRVLTRESMHRHTAHKDFPAEVFSLGAV